MFFGVHVAQAQVSFVPLYYFVQSNRMEYNKPQM